MAQQTRQDSRGDAAARSARLAALRAGEARRARRRRLLALAAAIAVGLGVIGGGTALLLSARDATTTGEVAEPDRARIEGERYYPDLASKHVSGRVDYPADPNPPVGGPHDATWQNADGVVYDRPLRTEHAVHSLEHGAVWLTYRADTPASDVAALRKKVEGVPYRMMSPLPRQPGRITLTAWGHQLTVTSAADPRIDAFFDTYVQGPQAPEAGAPVTGGRAEP